MDTVSIVRLIIVDRKMIGMVRTLRFTMPIVYLRYFSKME